MNRRTTGSLLKHCRGKMIHSSFHRRGDSQARGSEDVRLNDNEFWKLMDSIRGRKLFLQLQVQICCLGKFIACRKQGVRYGRETVEALTYAKSGHVALRMKINGSYLSRAITSMGSQRHGGIAHMIGVVLWLHMSSGRRNKWNKEEFTLHKGAAIWRCTVDKLRDRMRDYKLWSEVRDVTVGIHSERKWEKISLNYWKKIYDYEADLKLSLLWTGSSPDGFLRSIKPKLF